jgi:hypothetical protein
LQSEVRKLSTDFGCLVGKVSALRSASAGVETISEEISTVEAQIGQKLKDSAVEQLCIDVSQLRKEVLTPKVEIALMSLTVTPSQNQPPPPSPCINKTSAIT